MAYERPRFIHCGNCNKRVKVGPVGRIPVFCGNACRQQAFVKHEPQQAAHRRRLATPHRRPPRATPVDLECLAGCRADPGRPVATARQVGECSMNDHLNDKWPSLRWRLRKDREPSGLLQRLQASGIKPPPLDLTVLDRMLAAARPPLQAGPDDDAAPPKAARDAPTKRKPAPHDPDGLLTLAQAAARLNITPGIARSSRMARSTTSTRSRQEATALSVRSKTLTHSSRRRQEGAKMSVYKPAKSPFYHFDFQAPWSSVSRLDGMHNSQRSRSLRSRRARQGQGAGQGDAAVAHVAAD